MVSVELRLRRYSRARTGIMILRRRRVLRKRRSEMSYVIILFVFYINLNLFKFNICY